eukprot:Nitzschia sp. Nitz4//scaffold116_size91068//56724//59495//NITZ4_004961-RA/size91068-processed-gene-0.43-mRNA-1//1//CDS//3329533587//763//frame0
MEGSATPQSMGTPKSLGSNSSVTKMKTRAPHSWIKNTADHSPSEAQTPTLPLMNSQSKSNSAVGVASPNVIPTPGFRGAKTSSNSPFSHSLVLPSPASTLTPGKENESGSQYMDVIAGQQNEGLEEHLVFLEHSPRDTLSPYEVRATRPTPLQQVQLAPGEMLLEVMVDTDTWTPTHIENLTPASFSSAPGKEFWMKFMESSVASASYTAGSNLATTPRSMALPTPTGRVIQRTFTTGSPLSDASEYQKVVQFREPITAGGTPASEITPAPSMDAMSPRFQQQQSEFVVSSPTSFNDTENDREPPLSAGSRQPSSPVESPHLPSRKAVSPESMPEVPVLRNVTSAEETTDLPVDPVTTPQTSPTQESALSSSSSNASLSPNSRALMKARKAIEQDKKTLTDTARALALARESIQRLRDGIGMTENALLSKKDIEIPSTAPPKTAVTAVLELQQEQSTDHIDDGAEQQHLVPTQLFRSLSLQGETTVDKNTIPPKSSFPPKMDQTPEPPMLDNVVPVQDESDTHRGNKDESPPPKSPWQVTLKKTVRPLRASQAVNKPAVEGTLIKAPPSAVVPRHSSVMSSTAVTPKETRTPPAHRSSTQEFHRNKKDSPKYERDGEKEFLDLLASWKSKSKKSNPLSPTRYTPGGSRGKQTRSKDGRDEESSKKDCEQDQAIRYQASLGMADSDVFEDSYADYEEPNRALVILKQPNDTYQIMVGDSKDKNVNDLRLDNVEMVSSSHHRRIHDLVEFNPKCECHGSVFSGNDDLISFFLPQMGMACTCGKQQRKGLINADEPTAVENVLRPWQVEFLKSFGIKRGDQLVKARHRSAPILAKALRQWRRRQGMVPFKTSSCAMAIDIWAKTCKVYVRSIRKQLEAGQKLLDLHHPEVMNELSHFLSDLPSAPDRKLGDSVSFLRIEPESQVEV